MSELKAKHVVDVYDEYSSNPYNEAQVYIKSESDKVIADLEESHKKEVEQLLMEIVKLKEERRWRKFSEEKPEEWETVVVRFSNGFYDLAVYMSNGQGWDIGDGLYHKSEEVTHWMPLPKFEEK